MHEKALTWFPMDEKANTPVLTTPSHDKASSGHREVVKTGVEAEEDK